MKKIHKSSPGFEEIDKHLVKFLLCPSYANQSIKDYKTDFGIKFEDLNPEVSFHCNYLSSYYYHNSHWPFQDHSQAERQSTRIFKKTLEDSISKGDSRVSQSFWIDRSGHSKSTIPAVDCCQDSTSSV